MRKAIWLAAALGCARVETQEAPDAGSAGPPRIADLDPAPGAVAARAHFKVSFSEAMDEGQLLASSGRSETVVLAPEALVERAAAAIEHSRLSAEERSLIVTAQASIVPGAAELDLLPEQPLAPGGYWLLASTRLRDVSGRHLQAAARFHYTVAEAGVHAALVTPPAGATVAANLGRVRISVDRDGARVSVVGPEGAISSAEAARGIVELPLCPAWSGSGCSTLRAGQTYSVFLEGEPVTGASFTAGQCPRLEPPRGAVQLRPRDVSIGADVRLDWPARVAMQVGACPGSGCRTAEAFAICAPDPCEQTPDARCNVSLRVDGLQAGNLYPVQLLVEDDEGHLARGPVQQVVTSGALPRLVLAEVMASPPGPTPRSDGEYVEILNAGSFPVDVSSAGLAGADGVARAVLASADGGVVLGPGGRALAVGASFDEMRYAIPRGVPILRAATQRLLGRGLADDPPPLIALLATDSEGTLAEVDRFPGGGPRCPQGSSIEAHPDAGWACGDAGGSPGRPP